MPTTFSSLQQWREYRKQLPSQSLGFIPTMGNLHEGHGSLITRSTAENSRTLISIFVNPTQFNNQQDLSNYPRTLAKDLEYASHLGVDYILLPNYDELYPEDYQLQITENTISTVLEGKARPGHFTGVLTVVMKLLQLAKASRAYFGEKDYQQLMLIKKLCHAFFIDTTIVPCLTVREDSGLAMSSRNNLLSTANRKLAAKLYHLLSSPCSSQAIHDQLTELGFTVDYIEEFAGRRLAAVELQGVRLIDNIALNSLGDKPC